MTEIYFIKLLEDEFVMTEVDEYIGKDSFIEVIQNLMSSKGLEITDKIMFEFNDYIRTEEASNPLELYINAINWAFEECGEATEFYRVYTYEEMDFNPDGSLKD